MINCKNITILNLDEIDEFDNKKRGEYLFLIGQEFDFDYSINLEEIIKNFNYIIFFNQTISFIKKFIPEGKNIYDMPSIKNVLHIKEKKVFKVDSWGFRYSENSSDSIKYNYHMPNNENNKISFILNKKFIFPLFPIKLINRIRKVDYMGRSIWLQDYLNETEISQLLEEIKPQIVSLLEANSNVPNWLINYSKDAQKITIKIQQNIIKINNLNADNSRLANDKQELIIQNNFLSTDGDVLEDSIEKIIKKVFPNWIKLNTVDQEDLLFQSGNDIFIFEIKGTVKFINEGYVTQLMKYFPAIEEKYPEPEFNLFPVLFINSQKNIDPKERDFEYNKGIKNRITKYNISVITSTRLYNLLQQKNYEQLIMKDIKTTGIHDEKIISENKQELIETS